jgi:hypothetical protein
MMHGPTSSGAGSGDPFTVACNDTAIVSLGGLYTGVGSYFNVTYGGTTYTSTCLITGGWQSIVMKVVISETVGEITLVVDGVQGHHATNLNTGTSLINELTFNGGDGYFAATPIDDIWVFDTTGSHSNTFPVGDMVVQSLLPTADGTYQQWTPDSGSDHYSRVNEAIPDGDTSYVAATTAGYEDSYPVSSLTGIISQVHAVKTVCVARKDDVPPKLLRTLLKSGTTVSESSDLAPTTVYQEFSSIFNDDPNTSAQWTEGAVNDVELGMKVVA